MKKIILIIALAFTMGASAQDREQKFSVFTFIDPVATDKDGFNIGVGIDYQMTLMYFKAQLFLFPDLRGNNYNEMYGVVGFNKHFGDNTKWLQIRTYAGFKAGGMWRASGHGGGSIGGEIGADWNIPNTSIYIGGGLSHDLRTDGKAWGENEHNYWRSSGWAKIGFRY